MLLSRHFGQTTKLNIQRENKQDESSMKSFVSESVTIHSKPKDYRKCTWWTKMVANLNIFKNTCNYNYKIIAFYPYQKKFLQKLEIG